jgi:hypothetical protein
MSNGNCAYSMCMYLSNGNTYAFALALVKKDWSSQVTTHKLWALLPGKIEKPVADMFHFSLRPLGWATVPRPYSDGSLPSEAFDCWTGSLLWSKRWQRPQKKTVKEALHNRRSVRHIKATWTVQVILEYLSIWSRVEVILTNAPDQIMWRDGRRMVVSLRRRPIDLSSVLSMLSQGRGFFTRLELLANASFLFGSSSMIHVGQQQEARDTTCKIMTGVALWPGVFFYRPLGFYRRVAVPRYTAVYR